MKTIKIRRAVVMFLCVAAAAGFWSCTDNTIERRGGGLPDKDPLETTYGFLSSSRTAEREVDLLLTQGGGGAVTDKLYYQITKPATNGLSLEIRADLSEETLDAFNAARKAELQANGVTEFVPYVLLPKANFDLPDGKTFDISQADRRSASKRIQVQNSNLAAGLYLLPITVSEAGIKGEKQTLYYTITIRQPQLGDVELYQGDDMFFVFYINTDQYQPLLVDDYFMKKKQARGPVERWYNLVGNIINLRTVTLNYNALTKRAMLNLGKDMTYVLNHVVKYIRPLQDKGRKVCISIEGGGTGLGFSNLSDGQIADFVAQIKDVIDTYELDGINLWDRFSGYGKEGMPAVNTTSYPKLIKALREALGAEKLLTVTVYDKPTETFHDVEASGGIAVGDYIDYAWSGHNSNQQAVQLLDPWHPNLDYVSNYTQQPIANLPKERYGCVNFPIYPGTNAPEEQSWRLPSFLASWVEDGHKPNSIIVFDDLRTILQDNYETYWDVTFAVCCACMDNEGRYTSLGSKGYAYTLDTNRGLGIIPDGKGGFIGGYGKWLKDW